eukprot:CAMPEP_0169313156 /NCGR_PEP_ID=MMETSP1017-20121227/4431_1 /TAXON_ID=342587 /ORGANISM="Karlodinium micrum, Strain CCMP2283" /LENGTH=226 /DNA_ID=CAMNT_0009407003 /DNA_START=338 /DNA_END=1019 /DNA_ORIENTATION=+
MTFNDCPFTYDGTFTYDTKMPNLNILFEPADGSTIVKLAEGDVLIGACTGVVLSGATELTHVALAFPWLPRSGTIASATLETVPPTMALVGIAHLNLSCKARAKCMTRTLSIPTSKIFVLEENAARLVLNCEAITSITASCTPLILRAHSGDECRLEPSMGTNWPASTFHITTWLALRVMGCILYLHLSGPAKFILAGFPVGPNGIASMSMMISGKDFGGKPFSKP